MKRHWLIVLATVTTALAFAPDTATAAAPPGPVSSVSVTDVGKTTLTLHWANPSDASYTAVTIRRSVGTVAPADVVSGLAVADVAAPGTAYTDTGLAPGVTYSYALFAHDAIPTFATAAAVSARTTPLTFTTSTPAPYRGAPTSLSCHLTTSCTVVDDSGQWQHFNGSVWTAPTPLLSSNGNNGFTSVSCPAISFCMAVTRAGDAYIWNGLQWEPPMHIVSTLVSVSCPAANACWAVAGHFAYKYVDGTWYKQLVAGLAGAALDRISCATTTTCVAAGNIGGIGAYAWRWVAGGPWSSPALLFRYGGDAVWGLSCVAAANCMAVGDNSLYSRFNGTTWTTAFASYSRGPDLGDVSCAGPTMCMATSHYGGLSAMRWNLGSGWNAAQALQAPATNDIGAGLAVSCATSTMCLVMDSLGRFYRWTSSGWSSPATVDHTSGHLLSVNCPQETFCAALDGFGNVYGFDGQSWGPPRYVGGQLLTCPAAAFCLTVDTSSTGVVRQHIGTSWPVIATLNPVPNIVTCVSSTFCLGIARPGPTGPSGYSTVTWNGSRWSYQSGEPLASPIALSCPTSMWCMALDSMARAAIYDRVHSRWLAAPSVSSQPGLGSASALDCVSPTFCLAMLGTSLYRYDGNGWTHVSGIADVDTYPACVSSSFCLLGGRSGYQVYADGTVTPGDSYGEPPQIWSWSITCQDAATPFCVGVSGATAVVGR